MSPKDYYKYRYYMEQPDAETVQVVASVRKDIDKYLIPHLPFKTYIIDFVSGIRYLGMYIHDSAKKCPIVLLSMNQIRKGCKKYDLHLGMGVETTIVHELGHAFQDWHDIPANEEEAETFAREFHDFRDCVLPVISSKASV